MMGEWLVRFACSLPLPAAAREGKQFQILSLWRYREYNTWTSIGTALGLLRKEKGDGTQ